jgi:hypothetical protein
MKSGRNIDNLPEMEMGWNPAKMSETAAIEEGKEPFAMTADPFVTLTRS